MHIIAMHLESQETFFHKLLVLVNQEGRNGHDLGQKSLKTDVLSQAIYLVREENVNGDLQLVQTNRSWIRVLPRTNTTPIPEKRPRPEIYSYHVRCLHRQGTACVVMTSFWWTTEHNERSERRNEQRKDDGNKTSWDLEDPGVLCGLPVFWRPKKRPSNRDEKQVDPFQQVETVPLSLLWGSL